jgi:hypothetical protein
VVYAPTAAGEDDTAALAVRGPRVRASLALTGKSGTPNLAWSPTAYDFATVDAGDAPTHDFTLTNSGDGTSDVLTSSLMGSGSMTLSDDSCTGTTLAPGGTCNVTVQYAPTMSGQHDSATLSAGGADATITGKSGTPNLAWSPTPYDFGTVDAGDTPTQDFTLTNSGDGSSDSLTASLTGSDAMTLTATTCDSARLAPGGTCSVTVQYAPTDTSTDDATLSAGGAGADISGTGQAAAPVTGPQPQTISFTSNAPTDAAVGGPAYTPAAAASSGLAVSFSIDAASDSLCTISGGVVHFTGVGTCTIDANQPGDDDWSAAPQVQQSLDVGQGTQTISFTSTAPPYATLAGQTYTPTATATSGLPVTFSIDPASSSVCAISAITGAVNFIGLGTGTSTCIIHANQAGDDNWSAAQQVTQTIGVAFFPLIVVVNPIYDPQSPPLPPNPAANNCDPPTIIGGGCFINPLAGEDENIFDATGTIAPTTDTGFDPSLYTIDFHWQIFKPPGLSSAPYSSNGITGYHATVLDIQPDSLPELLGTDAGSDFYWRVELTVSVNGWIHSGFFKFQYQSSTLSLKLSTTCQLTGQSQTLQCQFAAANGLPATEPT